MIDPSATPSAKVRVLLVDDQKMIGEVVRRLLADQPDMEYRYCAEAEKAPALAQEFQPHVILQDLVMPGLNGAVLVRLYRAYPATAKTPVVILSASDDSGEHFEAMQAGANDFLMKLPPKAELLACIRRHAPPASA